MSELKCLHKLNPELSISRPTTVDRKKRSADAGDIARYAEMQESALRLDDIMHQMMREVGPEALAKMPKWKQLVGLRRSMQKLLPESHPVFEARRKKGVTMEFNGIDVSRRG